MNDRKIPAVVTNLAVLAVLLALWFAAAPAFFSELVFPSPASVAEAVRSLGWNLPLHAGVTFGRVTLGWLIGVPLGVLMGVFLSWSPLVRAVANPLIEIIRPLPPVALIPFFILWFGLGATGQLTLIALGCFMVLTVNTFTAAQSVPVIYIRAAISLGAPPAEVYRTIVLPAILPALFGGFRIAAALAFGVGIAAEFMGAQSGIGFLMMVARRTLNTNTILLGVIVIAAESFLLDSLLRAAARRVCRWTEAPLDLVQSTGLGVVDLIRRSDS